MRVAVISNMISPYHVPVFECLASRSDCDLLVIYETAIEPNRQWEWPTLQYRHVVLDSWTLDLAPLAVGSGTKLVSDIYVHIARHPLRDLIRFKPDAVVAAGGTIWGSPTNIAALTARGRHGWAFVPRWETHSRRKPTVPRRLAEPWVRRFFRSGDAWLAVGTRSAGDLVRLGADPARIFLWPMVSDPPPRSSARVAPRVGGPRYLFVGQLIERKGILELLEAFGRTDGGELWIAGNGPLAATVDAAANSDRRIRWFGYASVHDLYRQADVVVLPSRYDTWGMVVNEAIAHGLPVITTAEVGAADDLVVNGINGLVIPPNNVAALVAAMRDLAEWPQTRVSAGADISRRKLADWTFERAAEGIAEACAAAIRHHSRTTSRTSRVACR